MTVVMSDRERQLNRSTLRLLHEDKNLQARIWYVGMHAALKKALTVQI